jgi:hypothetical protein
VPSVLSSFWKQFWQQLPQSLVPTMSVSPRQVSPYITLAFVGIIVGVDRQDLSISMSWNQHTHQSKQENKMLSFSGAKSIQPFVHTLDGGKVGISGGMVYPGGKDVWNKFAGPHMLDRPAGLGIQDHGQCMIGVGFVGDMVGFNPVISSLFPFLRSFCSSISQ